MVGFDDVSEQQDEPNSQQDTPVREWRMIENLIDIPPDDRY